MSEDTPIDELVHEVQPNGDPYEFMFLEIMARPVTVIGGEEGLCHRLAITWAALAACGRSWRTRAPSWDPMRVLCVSQCRSEEATLEVAEHACPTVEYLTHLRVADGIGVSLLNMDNTPSEYTRRMLDDARSFDMLVIESPLVHEQIEALRGLVGVPLVIASFKHHKPDFIVEGAEPDPLYEEGPPIIVMSRQGKEEWLGLYEHGPALLRCPKVVPAPEVVH